MGMASATDELLARLEHEGGVLVQVAQTAGSTPRETGAWMVVWAGGLTGTVGGGNLEYQAMAAAHAMLAGRADAPAQGEVRRYALGPSLGQCCGGVVSLAFRKVGGEDRERLRTELTARLAPVAVFGGGHVGTAIVRLLATLPFAVRWIDSRDAIFPLPASTRVHTEYSDPMDAAVEQLTPGTRVLVLSFSHWEDLDIVRACLERVRERDDLPFLGLIGSRTKWATFRHRLQARGFTDGELARITCPIGIAGLNSKEPEIIAVSVAAQLLLETAGTQSGGDDSAKAQGFPANHPETL